MPEIRSVVNTILRDFIKYISNPTGDYLKLLSHKNRASFRQYSQIPVLLVLGPVMPTSMRPTKIHHHCTPLWTL